MRIHAIAILAFCALAPTGARAQDAPAAGPAIPQTTVDNLNAAIEGEANAVNRYTLFAQCADEEGYTQVAKLFRAASLAESIHRKNHEAVLRSHGIEPERPTLDKVKGGTTRENLAGPIQGETSETDKMYPEYIKQAQRDHVPDAVRSFTYALATEAEHEKLFEDALANLGENPRTAYYVSTVSGETVTKPPAARRDEYKKVD